VAFFLTILFWVGIFFISELLRPKPKFEDARPSGLGDFRFPTATEGRAVPLIWGRAKIEGPNVIWYGALRNSPITEKVKTGLFSSETITKGYRYYLGLQMAICRGPVDKITRIEVDDRAISNGRASTGTLSIVANNLFGGDEFGTGGMEGTIFFYVGDASQAQNVYLDGIVGAANNPAYRGTCYVVWQGGYIGNATSIQPWSFEIERVPDGLNMAAADPGTEIVNGQDANPLNVIYEIMTDTDWGLKIPSSEIDTTNFQTAASTVAGEGNGFSMVLDSEVEASEMINEVSRQIDGTVYFDRNAGLWKINLARDDYTPASLDLFDESNVIALKDFARQTWEETTNQVRLLFADQSDSWKETYALAQDMANVKIQGGNISADVNYPGVKNKTLANDLAWRDLRTLSFPLAKINFTVNREAYDKVPGDVFRFSWARLGISEVVFRVARLDYGQIEEGIISVYAVQDIFSAETGIFGTPIGTGWGDPDQAPVKLSTGDLLAFEAPRQMIIQDPFNSTLTPRVWFGGRDPGGGTIGFQGENRSGSSRPITAQPWVDDSTVAAFMLKSTLRDALSAYPKATPGYPDTTSLPCNNNDPDDIITALASSDNPFAVSSLVNIAYIGTITDQTSLDGEFIGWEAMVDVAGDAFLVSIYRGLFHTTPKAHAADDDIWFIGAGGNMSNFGGLAGAGGIDEIDVRLLSRGRFETTTTTHPLVEIHVDRIDEMPLAPRYPTLNGTFKDATNVDFDTDYSTETGFSLPDGYAIELNVTPRFWRVDDVLLDEDVTTLQNGRDYDDDSPVFDFVVTLDPSGTPAVLPTYTVSGSPDVDDPTVYALRNDAIVAVGSGTVMPTTAKFEVTAKHTVFESAVARTNPIKLSHEFTIVSALLIGHDQLTWGGFAVSTWSPVQTVVTTETYNFDIYTALPSSGILEGRLNGGSPVTIVAASASTGSIAVTAADTLELRFSQAPANDQFFDFNRSAGADEGYGVLEA
jgi:hypothetical protein